MNKFLTSIMLAAVVFAVSPSVTNAQVSYHTYTPRTQEETIAYLQGVVDQLIAQLAAQGKFYQINYTYGTPVPPRTYLRPGQVLGENYYGRADRVDVDTGFVSLNDNDIALSGTIDLNDASYAYVWFEYGKDEFRLNNRTDKKKIKQDSRFSITVDDLDDGDYFYYRAVAESQSGYRDYGVTRFLYVSGYSKKHRSNDDEPVANTQRADRIDEDSAVLNGEVDMNDFNNGDVFFVYGEDESQIEDVESDYDTYREVDEDGDDLQKVRVDSDLDSHDDYSIRVSNLDDNTDYYYQICVEYEDEDSDDTLECGGVEDFRTDRNNSRNSNDDEPEANTQRAEDVRDDEAELHGEVDMNDFDDGTVFFVYGEDESQVEDIVSDYDTYYDIDEDGDDLQKVRVYTNLDSYRRFWQTVVNLDDNTDHYYQICVEYEDEDGDDTLECGGVEHFETD